MKTLVMRKPRLGLILLTVALLVLLLAAIFLPHFCAPFPGFFGLRHVERNALSILRREGLHFLVTDRIATQIVVECKESNLLLGKKEGYLIAKVKLLYGIDLSKITTEDVVRKNGTLIVKLPNPEVLDFVVDIESLRFISKRSGLMVIVDWIRGADERRALLRQLQSAALQFVRSEDLIPSKETIAERLTKYFAGRPLGIGGDIVFK